MEKTVNATLHNLVDFATDKLFTNSTVEHAKDKFYDVKDKFRGAKKKYASKYFQKSDSSNVLLFTGLALAAAGAAYLIYKNRDAIKEQISSTVDKITDLQNQYMDNLHV